MADLRQCTRCKSRYELAGFAAIGEGKRHQLCKACWTEVRENRFEDIEVQADGAELQYVSFELSPSDFNQILDYLQDLMDLTDTVMDGIKESGFVPYMQQRGKTQLIYKR